MIADTHRRRALVIKTLAVVFWLAGLACALLALAETVTLAVSSVGVHRWAPHSVVAKVVGCSMPITVLLPDLALACVLLTVSRGVLLAYEALGYLRVLTGEDGYERHLGPTGPPLTISKFLLSIYKALVRFRNFGRFEDTEE